MLILKFIRIQTSGIFTLTFGKIALYGGFTVEICDLFSKRFLLHNICSPKTTIDLSFLDDGTYFVLLKRLISGKQKNCVNK